MLPLENERSLLMWETSVFWSAEDGFKWNYYLNTKQCVLNVCCVLKHWLELSQTG